MMFRIFIPFWNADDFLGRCIDSLERQNATAWTAHLYDDLSEDSSRMIATDFAARDSRARLVVNRKKHWQSGNLHQLSEDHTLADHDIVVQIDGDDWLPDPSVLDRIADAYEQNPNLLLTYGNFTRWRNGCFGEIGYCKEPSDFRCLRQLPWTTSAIKTHRVGLLRLVRGTDFRDDDGAYLSTVADLATGFPMLEMAGPERSRCLPDVNYVYNMDNPLRTPSVQRQQQIDLGARIRARSTYQLLTDAEARLITSAG